MIKRIIWRILSGSWNYPYIVNMRNCENPRLHYLAHAGDYSCQFEGKDGAIDYIAEAAGDRDLWMCFARWFVGRYVKIYREAQ
jgi:hypothetical protein